MYKLITAFVCLVLFSNCKKVDEFTQFNLAYESQVIISPATGLNLPLDLFTPDMETESESEFAVHNTNKDLIEEITLEKLDMKITAPSDQRFDFLNSVSVFINADGLAEIKIAELSGIPENVGSEIPLSTFENDLSEYIKKDKFNLRVKVVTDKAVNKEVQIDVLSDFFIDAKILGL